MTKQGGELTFVGAGDVDHLDPVNANYTATSIIERAYTRQLVTYPSTNDVAEAGRLVADMATRVPAAEGVTYTFTIREGVRWDTGPPRQVTAQDVVRGIKRLANPLAPCPLLQYFTETIKGLRDFAAKFSEAESIAGYLEGNEVEGVRAEDDRTVVFTLNHPTPDFLDILTLPFASAVPVEYLRHLPSSPEQDQHIISNGPYRITSYLPGREILLDRNPAWDQATDEVRGQYADRIRVVQGLTQREAFDRVLDGRADALWDVPPPTSELPALYGDPRLRTIANGHLNPCLIINLVSPNADGATGRLKVRQALHHALDKPAIVEVLGGPRLNTVTDHLLPPWNDAHRDFTLYPPDPARARRLLAEAGYPDGLTLRMIHRDAGNHPAVARAVQAGLARAGITVELHPVPQAAFYPEYLEVAENARRGVWDITVQGWLPDWQGNNARTYLQPHFDSSGIHRDDATYGVVYGCYRSARTNELIGRAVTAPTVELANELFHQAELQVLQDAAVVPIAWQRSTTLHSARVRGFTGFPNYLGDPTRMWIEEGST
ncbi:ABC transporter substrate-binding protein [Nonomuraea sp. NPDC050643]|uniref:ABC transporter substrate-binding protein n=1 Tax=Nonomuraea sp. NPDC050643 TaxID=3155660 RepID=UPI00340A7843